MTANLSSENNAKEIAARIGKMTAIEQRQLFQQMINEVGLLWKIHFLQDFVQALATESNALGFGDAHISALSAETKAFEQAYYRWAAAEAERRSKTSSDS